MGDACNMADIERFMRSEQGEAELTEIRKTLVGRKILDVTFSNEATCICTTFHLDDGETFIVFQPSLDVDALRERYSNVIEEEYFKDYPTRRPKENQR